MLQLRTVRAVSVWIFRLDSTTKIVRAACNWADDHFWFVGLHPGKWTGWKLKIIWTKPPDSITMFQVHFSGVPGAASYSETWEAPKVSVQPDWCSHRQAAGNRQPRAASSAPQVVTRGRRSKRHQAEKAKTWALAMDSPPERRRYFSGLLTTVGFLLIGLN